MHEALLLPRKNQLGLIEFKKKKWQKREM